MILGSQQLFDFATSTKFNDPKTGQFQIETVSHMDRTQPLKSHMLQALGLPGLAEYKYGKGRREVNFVLVPSEGSFKKTDTRIMLPKEVTTTNSASTSKVIPGNRLQQRGKTS